MISNDSRDAGNLCGAKLDSAQACLLRAFVLLRRLIALRAAVSCFPSPLVMMRLKKGVGYSPVPLSLLIARVSLASLFYYGLVLIFGLFLMGNNPLTHDFQRSREGRNGSCVHSPALPGDVARGAAAVCVSPEDDPPGTARSPMGGGG